jgi:hypothetical protein
MITKKDMRREIRRILVEEKFEPMTGLGGDEYIGVYLGSYMNLDPCGRFHHAFSPNGMTKKCERYWENLESVAIEFNCWIEPSDGDPTDIFLCKIREG